MSTLPKRGKEIGSRSSKETSTSLEELELCWVDTRYTTDAVKKSLHCTGKCSFRALSLFFSYYFIY